MARSFTSFRNNKKIKILIVDDDEGIAITLKAFLEEKDKNEEVHILSN
jgi:DNA-binding NarL/FixJ family response regulator